MKTIIPTLFFGAIIQQLASCQQVAEENYELRAEVTHEDGSPVVSAKISALYLKSVPESPILTGNPTPTEVAETDVTGHAVLKYKSLPTPSGGVVIGKKGYYGSSYPNVLWKPTGKYEDGSWQTEIKTVLKPVKNPIPMHANSMIGKVDKYIFVPKADQDYGYDLMMAQPLPPLGTGKVADFVFRVEGSFVQIDQHDLVLKINFSDKDEGLIEFLTPERKDLHEPHMDGSLLISQYDAPESSYKRTLDRHSKQKGASGTLKFDRSPERNFYFRTRIKRDPDGHIISSNYGKIYGDFDFLGGNMEKGFIGSFGWAATYFNPTPNDRNVEFDPKRNLNPGGNVRQP